MLKRLASDEDTLMLAKREAIIADLKRLVHINDEKNQLLIHMACQKVFVFFFENFLIIFKRRQKS